MIIHHGQADPVSSIDGTIRWYDKLNANPTYWRFGVPSGPRPDGGGSGEVVSSRWKSAAKAPT
jgi:hypothetical protein